MKDKIAFVAHSYHQKTRSYDFIVDYLNDFYEVELLFDEFWDTGKKIDWTALNNNYKAVIIFQMFPEKEDFEKIPNENIVYLPMYDHVEKWHFSQWYLCKDLKIVSFSSHLHKTVKKWGLNSIYVQYFIEPKGFFPGNEDEVFFWQRLTKVNIKTVKNLFKNLKLKLHIHKIADPGQEFIPPSKEDEEHFKITYSEWFNTKEELNDCIKNKAIYIAPRLTEGIGMSFLEALAQGKLIIANNEPTMNEYIQHRKTGYLCDFKHPKPIKIRNIREIQKNTYEYAKTGYEKWIVDREKILRFIQQPPSKNNLSLWVKLFLPFLFLDRRKIIKFKLGSNANLTILGHRII